MSKKNTFMVFGEEKGSLAEVIEVLGTKVTLKDIKAGKVEGVTIKEIDDQQYTEEELANAQKALDLVNASREKVEQEVATTESTDEANEDTEARLEEQETISDENATLESETTNTESTDKVDVSKMTMAEKMARLKELHDKKVAENPEGSKKGKKDKVVFDGTFPEVGSLTDEKDLKKIYKQLTNEQLDEWLALEGLTYKVNDNESINRMRKCMAITALHFPKTPSTKSKSKYADYTTEQLVEMAIDAELDIKDHKGDDRILRMYLIMALREAGILEAK